MRTARDYGKGDDVVYHCVTRTVNDIPLFDAPTCDEIRRALQLAADFSGVELMNYVVLPNAVHVLVRVQKTGTPLKDKEMLRRLRLLCARGAIHDRAKLAQFSRALEGTAAERKAAREQLMNRMEDLSEFMKTFKQRFTLWFNRNHPRRGTLWCDRYKSTIVHDNAMDGPFEQVEG